MGWSGDYYNTLMNKWQLGMKWFSSYGINRGYAYVTTFTSMMLVLDTKVQEAITVFSTNNGQQN